MNSLAILMGGALMMGAVIATAAGIARYSKFYRRELAESGNRELALDGLRGMAALMVAVYHAALSSTWLATGVWGDARNPILQLFGPLGVIIFFMLTGHLFWGKSPGREWENEHCEIMAGKIISHRPSVFVQPAGHPAGGGDRDRYPLAGAGKLETSAPAALAGGLDLAKCGPDRLYRL